MLRPARALVAARVAPVSPATAARLPALAYLSLADYQARAAPLAGVMAAREQADAATLEHAGAGRPGTCAPCLRATTLRGPQAVCDCADALSGPARALLHAAAAEPAMRPWSTVVLLGADTPLRHRLAELGRTAHAFSSPLDDGTLAVASGAAHMVIAIDALHRAAEPAAALTELRRVAAPGGGLLASFPFDAGRSHTEVRRRVPGIALNLAATPVSDLGWDVLAMARRAGWARAEMLHVWSGELGYGGPNLFLLRASA